jgi:hypothetical protein
MPSGSAVDGVTAIADFLRHVGGTSRDRPPETGDGVRLHLEAATPTRSFLPVSHRARRAAPSLLDLRRMAAYSRKDPTSRGPAIGDPSRTATWYYQRSDTPKR